MPSPRIQATREQLAHSVLPQYGEAALAERVLTITDGELDRIGELAAYYAWSQDALELLGGSMGGTRAMCLATIDVLEGNMRDPRLSQSLQESHWGSPKPDSIQLEQEHSLRLRATGEGKPASDA
ncbi:hypothetical protein [Conexibacter sp. S30A1]|jgi:hypothetical protein|uniref:hypothetical protein n=1 Tax=Conexibacter sp. S30A1 TaxID=2937800 RepID=UPI00200DAB7E|nr:hypothetical protein [Conexibacter sp. S30A1]